MVPFAVRVLRLPREENNAATQSVHMTEDGEDMDTSKPEPAQPSAEPALGPKEHARKERRDWYIHTVAFALGQLVLWALDSSWLVWQITDGSVPDDQRGPLVWLGRIWLTIWVIDTIWSWSYTIWPREKKAKS